MADKKRDILEFVEQSNFEQFTPTLPTPSHKYNKVFFFWSRLFILLLKFGPLAKKAGYTWPCSKFYQKRFENSNLQTCFICENYICNNCNYFNHFSVTVSV
jgi:hypothetical protein